MSTLEDRLRAKLEQLKVGFGRNPNIWKPPKHDSGERAQIRLIQYPHGDDPFVELWFHYNVGKGPGILCPKMNSGRSCPICEVGIEIRSSGEAADIDAAKKLYPKQRVYAIVVDRKDEVPTPRYWGFGVQIYEKLIGDLLDPKTKHLLDADKGIDMDVGQTKSAAKKYVDTDYKLDRNDSPLAGSQDEINKILAAIKPHEEVFKPMTIAEIKTRLEEWLSFGEENVEANSGETTVGGNDSAAVSLDAEPVVPVTQKDVEDDFERAVAARAEVSVR